MWVVDGGCRRPHTPLCPWTHPHTHLNPLARKLLCLRLLFLLLHYLRLFPPSLSPSLSHLSLSHPRLLYCPFYLIKRKAYLWQWYGTHRKGRSDKQNSTKYINCSRNRMNMINSVCSFTGNLCCERRVWDENVMTWQRTRHPRICPDELSDLWEL